MDNQLAIFEQKPIRRIKHAGEIWFSIVMYHPETTETTEK